MISFPRISLNGVPTRHSATAILGCMLSGCAAVWGGAHSVEQKDADGIVIQYDTGLTSSVRAQVLAREHCKQYGKVAEPVSAEMPGLLLGIVEEKYNCVAVQQQK